MNKSSPINSLLIYRYVCGGEWAPRSGRGRWSGGCGEESQHLLEGRSLVGQIGAVVQHKHVTQLGDQSAVVDLLQDLLDDVGGAVGQQTAVHENTRIGLGLGHVPRGSSRCRDEEKRIVPLLVLLPLRSLYVRRNCRNES